MKFLSVYYLALIDDNLHGLYAACIYAFDLNYVLDQIGLQNCFECLPYYFPLNFKLLMSCRRQSLLDHITVQLAPRAADELWFGSGQVIE